MDSFAPYAQTDDRLPTALTSFLSQLPPSHHTPEIGIVCGSGLGGLADALQEKTIVEYSEIEGWPKGVGGEGVVGHGKGLAVGSLGGKRVVCQMGRMHCYEGYAVKDVIFAVRLFKMLGCKAVILTNAAGAIDKSMHVGQIMCLHDHLSLPSLTSWNPLIGPNVTNLGPRFPPMSDAYDYELRKSVFRAAKSVGLLKNAVTEGTYAWVAGPTYETPAEGTFLRQAGASVVGMSTVPEVIAARHVGLRVLAISLVTNMVVYGEYRSAQDAVEREERGEPEKPWVQATANHEEVLAVGKEKAEDFTKIVTHVVGNFRS